jgi:MFS family permease
MLPVVTSATLARTSTGYGILLGCLGAGAVVGAAILAPLRRRYSEDHIVVAGVVLFAVATLALATIHNFGVVALAMLLGGVAWMTAMSTFSVCAQSAPPLWLRARALAVYLMVFQGALAVGSGIWGELAGRLGVRGALLVSAATLVVGLAAGFWLPLSTGEVEEPQDSLVADAQGE